MAKNTKRVQMRVADLYKYMAIGVKVEIDGIDDYDASTNIIRVKYEGQWRYKWYRTNNEHDRRIAIKEINKTIGDNLHVTQ